LSSFFFFFSFWDLKYHTIRFPCLLSLLTKMH
jgi:hypothetical protein